MQGIEFQIVNDSAEASKGLDDLGEALKRLKSNLGGAGTSLNKAAAGITSIKNALNKMNTGNFESQLQRISKGLEALNTKTAGLKISSSIGNQLREIGSSLNAMPDTGYEKLNNLANGLKPLGELGKQQIGPFLTQLKKLPDIINDLQAADIDKFTQQMKDLATAMKPFSDEMQKVSNGFSAFPSRIQKLVKSTEQYNGTVKRATNHTNAWGNALKTLSIGAVFRTVSKLLASAINKSNQYTETLNMFTVSMGEYAQEAYEYAQKVSEVMGIDPSTWMENQGVFNSIITGFGVAGDKAAVMSKNLTQLAYDLSSFYNTDITSAMQKVQSGISGELEPLRRLGYDLSVARLQQEALNLGIEKSVPDMTQAEKAQLRYHAMLTQVTQVQGDMARTLQEPANQIRVLQAQLTQAARTIGNLFIPALNAILPVAIAVASAVREIVSAIAALFGIQMADSVDWGDSFSGAAGATGDIADNMDSAAGSAKELKKYLAGFDELNVLPDQNSGGSGSGAGGGGSGFDIEPIDYDFLSGAVTERIEEIKEKLEPFVTWIKDNLDEIMATIVTITGMFAIAKLWKTIKKYWQKFLDLKIVNTFLIGFNDIFERGDGVFKGLKGGIDNVRDSLSGVQQAAIIAVAGVLEFTTIKSSVEELALGCDDVVGKIATIGITAGVAAGAMYVALGPAGVAVAAVVGLAAAVVGVTEANQEMMDNLVNEAFYSDCSVKLSTLSENYGLLMQSIIDTNQPIIDNQGKIDELRTSITKTSDSVGSIASALAICATDASTEIDKLKILFNSLKEDTASIMDEIYNNILTAIGGSFGQALISAGESIPEVLEVLNQIKGEGTNTLASLQQELDNLNVKLENGEISGAEFQEAWLKIEDQLNSLIGVASETDDVFGDLKTTIGSIDWEDNSSVSKFFEDITETTANAKTSVNESSDAIIESLNTMKNWVPEGSLKDSLEKWITIAESDRTAQLASIDSQLTLLYDAIQMDMVEKTQNVQTKAQEAWSDMSWLQKAFSGESNEASYVSSAIRNYESNIIQPISEDIQDSMEKLGVDGTTWASDAMTDILDGLFEFNGTRYGSIIYEYQSSLDDEISRVFANLQESGKITSFNTGTEIASSLESGFESEIGGFGTTVDNSIIDQLKGGSLKSIGERYGKYFSDGFSSKIKNYSWPTIEGIIEGTTDSTVKFKIKAYATGGFPETGQLFIAREAGAEMVGSIGGRTAVANNDQIVEAVSAGVYQAVLSAMSASSSRSGGGQMKVIVATVDGRVLFETLVDEARNDTVRTGYNRLVEV